jgi:hypothetical protein
VKITSIALEIVFPEAVEQEGVVQTTVDKLQEILLYAGERLRAEVSPGVQYSMGTGFSTEGVEEIVEQAEEMFDECVKKEVERQLREMFRGDL